jgi:hypothetical protein
MAQLGRTMLAVIAGAAVWAVLWIGGTKAIQLTPPVTSVGTLLGLIGYSIVLSLLAGFVTAATAGPSPRPAVWALALLQLALGVIAETSAWSATPVWYHVVFLALVVPATAAGGVIRAASRVAT